MFVAYPAAFDFMFVYWYIIRFAGESPFSYSALDIKTYAMALLKKPYRKSVKKRMPTPRTGLILCLTHIMRWRLPSNKALCFAICWRKTWRLDPR